MKKYLLVQKTIVLYFVIAYSFGLSAQPQKENSFFEPGKLWYDTDGHYISPYYPRDLIIAKFIVVPIFWIVHDVFFNFLV